MVRALCRVWACCLTVLFARTAVHAQPPTPADLIVAVEALWPKTGAVEVKVVNHAVEGSGFETAYHFGTRAWYQVRWDLIGICTGRLPDGRRFTGKADRLETWEVFDDGGRESQGAPGRIFPQLLLTAMLREPGAFQGVRRTADGWVFEFRLPRGQLGQRLEEMPASFVESLGGPDQVMRRVEVYTDDRYYVMRVVKDMPNAELRVIETDPRGPPGFQVAAVNSDLPSVRTASLTTTPAASASSFELEQVKVRVRANVDDSPRRSSTAPDPELASRRIEPMRGQDTTPMLERREVWLVLGVVLVGAGVFAWVLKRRAA